MFIYPKNLTEQVDFNYLIQMMEEFCVSLKAKELVNKIKPVSNYTQVLKQLEETSELLLAIHKGDPLQINYFPNADKELQLLTIENAVLSTSQMLQIRNLVQIANDLIIFLSDKEIVYPTLKSHTDLLQIDTQIRNAIDDLIDKDGIMHDHASVVLSSIRKELQSNRKISDRLYRLHLQKLKRLGFLADIEESFVNGRRVLGIFAEHKREVKGIILGQSSSGKITFIEPQDVISLNNDRLALEEDEKEEVYRILKELTAFVQPFQAIIQAYYHCLVSFDFIRAKALLARDMNACMPKLLQSGNTIKLVNAFHPVLLLQNKKKKTHTESLTCHLSEENRIMVISGPNAGGKSITLKAIGLFQIMLQCGLLIPASAKSEFSIKKKIFGDIGDNQSIEDGLSTYSSRLLKMKHFLEHTDEHTLFLIDEFGTGSDPDMGGALAEVILDKLNFAGAQGIVTTHFTNLKILANNKEGVFNACMLFNSKTLKPLYQLHIGEPGSSFTFEVAEKIGLDQQLLDEAKTKLSNEKLQMDKLLNTLQKEKNALLKLKRDLQKQISKASAEKREFQGLSEKAEESFIENLKNREEKKKLMEYGKKLLQLTNEWMENQNKKEIISKFVKLAGYELHKKRAQEEYEKTEKFKVKQVEKIKSKIKTGSKVRMMKSREIGTITAIDKDRAKVLFGNLVMDVGLEKLEIA